MNAKKSMEFYIAVCLSLFGIVFFINYFSSKNILDLIYGGLLIVYSFKLYYIERKKIKL